MKRMLALVLIVMMILPISGFAEDLDARVAELEELVAALELQIAEKDARIAELEAQLNGSEQKSTDQESYSLGETWTVADQWSLTLLDVEEVTERNEYADTNPEAVYIVTYEYENLGYDDEYMNGLFLSIDMGSIVDAAGSMGYSYPGDVTYYPQETPIGAKCKAQVCIGVDNAGDFQIHFYAYDGNYNEYSTVFEIAID